MYKLYLFDTVFILLSVMDSIKTRVIEESIKSVYFYYLNYIYYEYEKSGTSELILK